MIFRSQKNTPFITIMATVVIIMFAGLIVPLFFDTEKVTSEVIIRLSIFTASIGFILWFMFSMKYTFLDKHLLIKGAFISSRIPYENITIVSHISGITDALSGYKLLTSTEGLEISYKSKTIGSVKISPEKKDLFISELKKRCPNIKSA